MVTLVVFSLCAVCASTSVSAAQGSSANVQAPALVGAPAGSAPAVCAQDAYNLYLFVKGTNGDLLWRHWNNIDGFSDWKSLGGFMTADPAAVYRSPGMINVFVRGGDGALWSRYTTDGGTFWSTWYKIGGQLAEGTGPAAYAWPGRIGWVVIGTNHALWHAWNDLQGAHNWHTLGGYLTSSPAVTSLAPDRLNVFGRGQNGALWTMSYDRAWGAWTSLGGQIAPGTAPAVCSMGRGGSEVFVIGKNGALWHVFMPDQWGARWSWDDHSLGGYLTSSPAAASRSAGEIDVCARGGNGHIWTFGYYNYNELGPWLDIGGI
jgi:hypothetical protein